MKLHLQKQETQSAKIKKRNKRANIQTKRQQQTANTKTSSYIKRKKKRIYKTKSNNSKAKQMDFELSLKGAASKDAQTSDALLELKK